MGSQSNIEPVTAYLGLGSNLGDREGNLRTALELLSARMLVGQVSSLYDTAPVGEINQPRFLNQVCQVRVRLAPAELLAFAKGIESRLGRKPGKRNAPRPIDIDILFYGDQIISTPELVVPHPRLIERAFVLVPLAEIAPDLVHPVSGKSIRELLQGVAGTGDVVRWETSSGRVS